MLERVLIIMASCLILLGAVGYYEKRQAGYIRTNAELHESIKVISLNCYKKTKQLEEFKFKCTKVANECATLIKAADDIIRNKKNCTYAADKLERTL